MSDQPSSNNNNNRPTNPNNNNRNPNQNNNNNRPRPQGNNNQPQGQNPNQRPPNPNQGGPKAANPNQRPGQGQPGQQNAQGGAGGGQRRRPNRNNNRPRNPNAQAQNNNPNQNQGQPHGINIERIYEKYLNLLDQHLIARRKYHDLFYRADNGQKNKLERNFYNTLNDIRDFESKLAPEARELFEKRNNGLRQDNTYTTNHELPTVGDTAPPESERAEPHFLQSQKVANYAEDKEESVGNADDYLKYKNLI